MGAVGFKKDNKAVSAYDIDTVKLEQGQKARFIILDKDAEMEWCHYVRTPTAKNADAGKYYFCLGHDEVMRTKGVDPERCPFCRVASAERDAPVPVARRRFALNVARYNTNSQGAVLQPIGMVNQHWIFGDDKFNALVDQAEEHGDLRKLDIVAHCTVKQYAKWELILSNKVRATDTPDALAQWEACKKARSTDIRKRIGNEVAYEKAEDLVADALPDITVRGTTAGPDGFAGAAGQLAFDPDDEEDLPAGGALADDDDGDELPAIKATAAAFAAMLEDD